jgi:hypothetical protein
MPGLVLWADTLSTALKDQGAAPVLQALRRLHPRRPNGKDEVRKAIDYFTLNADRMHYTQYAAAGRPGPGTHRARPPLRPLRGRL